ncbi:basic amino acid ABC transporter substrate-binding protein, partial [Halobacteriales archaeon QS_5_70_17]
MNRREFLATVGAGAVAVSATSGVVAAQDNESGGGNESGGDGGGGGGSGPIDYGGWFSDVP